MGKAGPVAGSRCLLAALRRAAVCTGVVGLLLLAASCRRGGGGELRLEALAGEPLTLGASLPTAVYAIRPTGDVSFILTDASIDDLLAGTVENAQIVHFEVLWEPKAGQTPMDSSATNTMVRHVIVSDGEVGVYGGAGFTMSKGEPGQAVLEVSVLDATLRLLEATAGFVDPLSPARAEGKFKAVLDPVRERQLRRAASQFITNAFGETRYVQAPEAQHLAQRP